jgi:glycosyltransferase involved in cell wall biosynthesis
VQGLSEELVRLGHEVTVYATDSLDSSRRINIGELSGDQNGVNVRYFKNLCNKLAYNQRVFISRSLNRALKEDVSDFDIIHLHEYRTFLSVYVMHECLRHEKPYVVCAHGSLLPFFQKKLLKNAFDLIWGRKVLERASAYIAVSKAEADQYIKMKMDGSKIEVIYNGFDFGPFDKLPEAGSFRRKYLLGDSPFVLFVGRVNKIKGIDFLLEALARARGEIADLRLFISGTDDGYLREVFGMVEKFSLNDNFRFIGQLAEAEKLEALMDSNLFAYPSRYEVFGLAPVEALACSIPAIISKNSGLAEILEGIDYGLIAEPGNVDEISKMIINIIKEPFIYRKMAAKALDVLKRTISFEQIARQTETLYRKVLA